MYHALFRIHDGLLLKLALMGSNNIPAQEYITLVEYLLQGESISNSQLFAA